LGQSTPNILVDQSLIYGVNFFLDDDWFALTAALGLDFVDQTYMIWLWLDTGMQMTYSRMQNGGNPQLGLISGVGSQALWNSMTIMQLELPMFIAASQLNISYAVNVTNGQTCNSFYTTQLGFSQDATNGLCNDATGTFNWMHDANNNQGYFKTAVALTSIYLYGNAFNTANADYYDLFLNLTGYNALSISNAFQNPSSPASVMMTTQIEAQVFNHYSTVSGNICDGISGMCSWGNLTYNQWLRGDVLQYPLPAIVDIEPLFYSYVIYYEGYSVLTYPPEAFYYGARSGNLVPYEATIDGTYRGMCASGFFDVKYFQDLWLGINDFNWET
jgi:hypothetical protein